MSKFAVIDTETTWGDAVMPLKCGTIVGELNKGRAKRITRQRC